MIYVFDFDLTLTFINSKGEPLTMIEKKNKEPHYFFYSQQNVKILQDTFQKIINNNSTIIILTRGLKQEVEDYLKLNNLLKYISAVLGSSSREESKNPILNKQELSFFDQKMIDQKMIDQKMINQSKFDKKEDQPTIKWAYRKLVTLINYCDNKINYDSIIFFDDNSKNINICKTFFRYSFLITNRFFNTINLVNYLLNFKTIIDIAKLSNSKFIPIKHIKNNIFNDRYVYSVKINDKNYYIFIEDLSYFFFTKNQICKFLSFESIIFKYETFNTRSKVNNIISQCIKEGGAKYYKYKKHYYKLKFNK